MIRSTRPRALFGLLATVALAGSAATSCSSDAADSTSAAPTSTIAPVSFVTRFTAPPGYGVRDTESTSAVALIAAIAAVPELRDTVKSVTIGELVSDDTGVVTAQVLVGVTVDESRKMPSAWSAHFCDVPASAAPLTTPGGYAGITCTLTTGGRTVYVFSETSVGAAFTMVTADPAVDLAGTIDAFWAANG